jgi:uncharacterized SAM-binding protein YcdF (DUF218 family)
MIVPDAELRRSLRANPKSAAAELTAPFRLLAWALLLLLLAVIGWCLWVGIQIRRFARTDQARPAGAIAVFGAAEYDGHPSPVLRARLTHALDLYQRRVAPLIITLGGGGDWQYSEGGVGRQYLLAHGVPAKAVIAETVSGNTEESAEHLAVIARAHNISSIVAVSDATHLFRIHALCQAEGLTVYTSPRPPCRPISDWSEIERFTHELASYTLWRLHLH